jgi:hypothetical protein
MEVTWKLKLVRFTAGGKGLYKDLDNHNIYMTKDEMHDLGMPDEVEVTVNKVGKHE